MATDYDTPRKTDDDVDQDSLEELKARRNDKSDLRGRRRRVRAGRGSGAARRRPLQRGAVGPGAAPAGRRVHLHELLPGAPPQPAGPGEERPADLPRLRLRSAVAGDAPPGSGASGRGPGHRASPAARTGAAQTRPRRSRRAPGERPAACSTPRRRTRRRARPPGLARGRAGRSGRRPHPDPGPLRRGVKTRASGRAARARRPASASSPTASSTSPPGSPSGTWRRCARSSPGSAPRRSPTSWSRARRNATSTVGAGIGAAAMLPVPPAMPAELAAEITGVAAIELKLIAELHEVYGCRPPGGLQGARHRLSALLDRGARHRRHEAVHVQRRPRQPDEARNAPADHEAHGARACRT